MSCASWARGSRRSRRSRRPGRIRTCPTRRSRGSRPARRRRSSTVCATWRPAAAAVTDEAPAGPPSVPGVEHRFVQSGAVRLHVAEAGTGDPVLLLHGWPQHWYCWRRIIPRLVGDHRVLCPDLRGSGWSDAPRTSYAKDELAGDVIALLDALELDRVRLVGHDWGGFIGFLVALQAPERIRDLLAFSIVHPWASRPRAAALARLPLLAYQPLVAAPILGPLAH